MNKHRLGILIVASLGAFATFLPWYDNSKYDVRWITLVLFAIPLMISLFYDKTKVIKGSLLFVVSISGIIAGIIGIWKIIDFISYTDRYNASLLVEAEGVEWVAVDTLVYVVEGDYGVDSTVAIPEDIIYSNDFPVVLAPYTIEFGLYLVVIAGFVLPLVAYLVKDETKNGNE